MFNNSSKIMFTIVLIISTIITISSNSWFSAWMGLEINMLSFIPLMNDNNSTATEASLKYFLTQALASAVLLFSYLLMMISINYENYLMMNYEISLTNLMIFSSLLLKLGSAPFHFWFPDIIEGLSWMNCFILMTWQKIAPLMLLSYLINLNMVMMITCSIFSTMWGAIGGLNQSFLRKLMAYSSINHLGWMLSSMAFNQNIWMIYYIFYTFLSFILIFMFNLWNIFHINKMFSLFNYSKILKFCLMFNLLSLGGLPPFLGFIPKWLVINLLSFNNQYLLIFILIMFTLITLYFYLKICYSSFMLNHYENSWIYNIEISWLNFNLNLMLSMISMFSLPLISLIYLMF